MSSIFVFTSRIAKSDYELHTADYTDKDKKVKQKIPPDREIFLKLQPMLYSYDNNLL